MSPSDDDFLAPDRLERIEQDAKEEYRQISSLPGFDSGRYNDQCWKEIHRMELQFKAQELARQMSQRPNSVGHVGHVWDIPMTYIHIGQLVIPAFDAFDIPNLNRVNVDQPLMEQTPVLNLLSKQWKHQQAFMQMDTPCEFATSASQPCGEIVNGNNQTEVTKHLIENHGSVLSTITCPTCKVFMGDAATLISHIQCSHLRCGVFCPGCGYKDWEIRMRGHIETCEKGLRWLRGFIISSQVAWQTRARC